jgi:hypothetical protein
MTSFLWRIGSVRFMGLTCKINHKHSTSIIQLALCDMMIFNFWTPTQRKKKKCFCREAENLLTNMLVSCFLPAAHDLSAAVPFTVLYICINKTHGKGKIRLRLLPPIWLTPATCHFKISSDWHLMYTDIGLMKNRMKETIISTSREVI